MFDWKKKVDVHMEQERLQKEQERQRENVRKEEEKRRQDLKAKEEEQARRQWLARKFQCHVCGTPASGPHMVDELKDGLDNENRNVTYMSSRPDWTLPNLELCILCHEWTCTNDIYHGICKTCAEKL